MAAATYWRLDILATAGGQYAAMGELILFTQDGGRVCKLQTGPCVITASSEYSATFAAGKAFDGLGSTGWSSTLNAIPAWLQVQFPSPKDVVGVCLMTPGSGFSNPHLQMPTSFALKSSNDGTTWTNVITASGLTWTQMYAVKYFGPQPDSAIHTPVCSSSLEFGGTYRITGTVDELGVPGKYRIRLFDRYTGRCIRETWSDPVTGAYAFERLANKVYFSAAFDIGSGPLNAAIADMITPEPMP